MSNFGIILAVYITDVKLGYLTAAQLDCESALYHVPDLARARRIQQQAAEQMAANDAALRKDYYKILGLPRGRLTDAEIKRAWREMCLKYHPDKVGNSDRARLLLQDIQAVTISILMRLS
jgi:DnaJ-domain-containing protein 1